MAGVDQSHYFGTADTGIKLSVVENYLAAYMTALRPHFRKLWYFDAFAGTGTWSVKIPGHSGDMLNEPTPETVEHRRGSARIAIDTEPPFDRIFLLEEKLKHVKALLALREQYSGRDITVVHGDANTLIPQTIRSLDWRGARAVMFLDPYGMQVDWETLKAIAATKSVDVWYLFSLSGLYRQAARNIEDVDPVKRQSLTKMLGTSAWEKELYSVTNAGHVNMFDQLEEPEMLQRNADVAGLERYVLGRLRTIFPLVMEPLALPVNRRPQMFSLFFAVSNDDHKALALAKRFGKSLLKSP